MGGKQPFAAEQHKTVHSMEAEVGFGSFQTWLDEDVSGLQLSSEVPFERLYLSVHILRQLNEFVSPMARYDPCPRALPED